MGTVYYLLALDTQEKAFLTLFTITRCEFIFEVFLQ